MNHLWFNLRILIWHFQIHKGDLVTVKVSRNLWWWCRELLWKPMWLYSCDFRAAWRHRGETHWKPQAQAGSE